MDVREELCRLYRKYNPHRLKDVDAVLAQFKGRERTMLYALKERYGRDSAASTETSSATSSAPSPAWVDQPPQLSSPQSAVNTATHLAGRSTPATTAEMQPVYPGVVRTPSTLDARALNSSLPEKTSVTSVSHLLTRPVSPTTAVAFSLLSENAEPAIRGYERQGEMQLLIEQMGSVDIGQLADRVGALANTMPSAPLGRVPRLQLRSDRETSTSSDQGNRPNDNELKKVLQHTAVFLTFFSKCAQRFLLLAREEQGEIAARPCQLPKHLVTAATDPTSCSLTSPTPRPHVTNSTESERIQQGGSSAPAAPASAANPSLKSCDYQSMDRENTLTSTIPPTSNEAAMSSANGAFVTSTEEPNRGKHGTAIETSSVVPHRHPPCPLPHDSIAEQYHATRQPHRSSCVRGIRPIAAPTSPLPAVSTSASIIDSHTKGRVHVSSGDRQDQGGSSSPTYRAVTVSPLTSPSVSPSPNGRNLSKQSPLTPLPLHNGQSPQTTTAEHLYNVVGSSPVSTPTVAESTIFLPPSAPPPQCGGALIGQSVSSSPPAALAIRRVQTWLPSPRPNRYAASCAALQNGDCIVFQPGVYYEELTFENCGHVRLTTAYPGAAVVLRPSSNLAPVLTIRGPHSRVELRGIVLVQGDGADLGANAGSTDEKDIESDREKLSRVGCLSTGVAGSVAAAYAASSSPTLPLMAVRDGADVHAVACHFYGGAGGGMIVSGQDTHAKLDLCLISLCGFAGLYVNGGARAELAQSKIKRSEAGMRVLQSSFYIRESTLEDNKTDGLVVYEGSTGVLEGVSLLNNGGNGLFLEGGAGSGVRIIASTIELNALYGVQRFKGSTLHVKSSFIRDNGLLPISEESV